MQQLLQAAFVQLGHIGNQRIDVSSKWIRTAIVYMDTNNGYSFCPKNDTMVVTQTKQIKLKPF